MENIKFEKSSYKEYIENLSAPDKIKPSLFAVNYFEKFMQEKLENQVEFISILSKNNNQKSKIIIANLLLYTKDNAKLKHDIINICKKVPSLLSDIGYRIGNSTLMVNLLHEHEELFVNYRAHTKLPYSSYSITDATFNQDFKNDIYFLHNIKTLGDLLLLDQDSVSFGFLFEAIYYAKHQITEKKQALLKLNDKHKAKQLSNLIEIFQKCPYYSSDNHHDKNMYLNLIELCLMTIDLDSLLTEIITNNTTEKNEAFNTFKNYLNKVSLKSLIYLYYKTENLTVKELYYSHIKALLREYSIPQDAKTIELLLTKKIEVPDSLILSKTIWYKIVYAYIQLLHQDRLHPLKLKEDNNTTLWRKDSSYSHISSIKKGNIINNIAIVEAIAASAIMLSAYNTNENPHEVPENIKTCFENALNFLFKEINTANIDIDISNTEILNLPFDLQLTFDILGQERGSEIENMHHEWLVRIIARNATFKPQKLIDLLNKLLSKEYEDVFDNNFHSSKISRELFKKLFKKAIFAIKNTNEFDNYKKFFKLLENEPKLIKAFDLPKDSTDFYQIITNLLIGKNNYLLFKIYIDLRQQNIKDGNFDELFDKDDFRAFEKIINESSLEDLISFKKIFAKKADDEILHFQKYEVILLYGLIELRTAILENSGRKHFISAAEHFYSIVNTLQPNPFFNEQQENYYKDVKSYANYKLGQLLFSRDVEIIRTIDNTLTFISKDHLDESHEWAATAYWFLEQSNEENALKLKKEAIFYLNFNKGIPTEKTLNDIEFNDKGQLNYQFKLLSTLKGQPELAKIMQISFNKTEQLTKQVETLTEQITTIQSQNEQLMQQNNQLQGLLMKFLEKQSPEMQQPSNSTPTTVLANSGLRMFK